MLGNKHVFHERTWNICELDCDGRFFSLRGNWPSRRSRCTRRCTLKRVRTCSWMFVNASQVPSSNLGLALLAGIARWAEQTAWCQQSYVSLSFAFYLACSFGSSSFSFALYLIFPLPSSLFRLPVSSNPFLLAFFFSLRRSCPVSLHLSVPFFPRRCSFFFFVTSISFSSGRSWARRSN